MTRRRRLLQLVHLVAALLLLRNGPVVRRPPLESLLRLLVRYSHVDLLLLRVSDARRQRPGQAKRAGVLVRRASGRPGGESVARPGQRDLAVRQPAVDDVSPTVGRLYDDAARELDALVASVTSRRVDDVVT